VKIKQESNPNISVVIIGYNSGSSLPKLIESLINQTANTDTYELIFVDDGSVDDSVQIWKSAKFQCETHIVQHAENCGRSTARNSGIAKARGEFCLFTNANIVLSENWIKGYVDFFTKYPNTTGVCGLISYTSSDKKFGYYLNRKARGLHRFSKGDSVPPENVLFANASIRRDILEEVNGFDENFKSYGGQELDLMLRIYTKYTKVRFCSNISVVRENHPNFFTHCSRLEDFGKTVLPLLFKKHPNYFKNNIRWLKFAQVLTILFYFIGKLSRRFYRWLPISTFRFILRIFTILGYLKK